MKRQRVSTVSALPAVLPRCILAFLPFDAVLLDWPLVCRSVRDAVYVERDKRVAIVRAMMQGDNAALGPCCLDIVFAAQDVRSVDGGYTSTQRFMENVLAELCVLQLDLPTLETQNLETRHFAFAMAAMAWRGRGTKVVILTDLDGLQRVSSLMDQIGHLIDQREWKEHGQWSGQIAPLCRGSLLLYIARTSALLEEIGWFGAIDVAVQHNKLSNTSACLSFLAGRAIPRAIFAAWPYRPAKKEWPVATRRCEAVFAYVKEKAL